MTVGNESKLPSLNPGSLAQVSDGVPAQQAARYWRQGALPGFIEPALATSIDKVPNGARWIHEIKFDGYRVQLHLAHETVRVFTRL